MMSRAARRFLGLLVLTGLVWMALVVWSKHQSTAILQQVLAHFQSLQAVPETLDDKQPGERALEDMEEGDMPDVTQPQAQVAIQQVELPPVPSPPVPEQLDRITPTPQQVAASDTNIVKQQRSVVPGEPKGEAVLNEQILAKQDIETSFEAASKPDNMPPVRPQPVVTTRDVYKQLSEDEALNIQLAWPGDRKERETVLNYLYQCVGAEFAIFDGQALTYLSPEQYKATSSWLRVAQGELSQQEQQWRNHNTQPGTLVRIVPEQVDINLSSHIASTLTRTKTTLHALRGRYALRQNKLYLVNITVNNAPVAGDWLLYNPGARC
ncbi:hypothetical protein [Aestuariibacter sp. A3R04]|uniref:hypothetical protein n=1 Tax=Aestuariibacter sp. A3R04 TaxID=2841571 RepID=UPI001C0992B3|nr:hypothetical protein [Aestuariibacter sp. A3R04]MBU3020515.1 hypothetical protein [Aestuariibacter sp. A3R04]